MQSVEYIDYFAVWYGRFLLRLNYSQMMRVHMNPNLDIMINKARPSKKNFDPKAFLYFGRTFDFMKVKSVLAIVQQVWKRGLTATEAEKLLVYRYGPVMEKIGVGQILKTCKGSLEVELNFKFSVHNVVSLLKIPSYMDEKLYAKGAFNPCALGNFFIFPTEDSKPVAEQIVTKYTGIDNTIIYEAPDENVYPIFFKKGKSEKSVLPIEKYYDVTTNRIFEEYKRSDGWKKERLFRDVVDEVFLAGLKKSDCKDKQSGTFVINRLTKGIEILERVLTTTSQVYKNSDFLKDSREAAVQAYKEDNGDSESDLEPFEKLESEDEESNKKSKRKKKVKKKRKSAVVESASESSNDSDDDDDDDNKKQGSNSSNSKSKKHRSLDDKAKKNSDDESEEDEEMDQSKSEEEEEKDDNEKLADKSNDNENNRRTSKRRNHSRSYGFRPQIKLTFTEADKKLLEERRQFREEQQIDYDMESVGDINIRNEEVNIQNA